MYRTRKSLLENKGGDVYKKSTGFLQSDNKKSLPNVELSSDTWRRRWDSNPRDIAVKLISSQVHQGIRLISLYSVLR